MSKPEDSKGGAAHGGTAAGHASAAAKSAPVQHLSLYRKYRPAEFKDVIDQDQVVSVLQESIRKGTIAHAYLFCGSRGTGKTSVARIFAKALGTSQNDLYEIDAASNTSVDDIRELSEAVNTVPLESKYKVYILDEVHMLSKAAFNAFLKTLEEPPRHVIFILATTEMEKLPETIVSRCEVYNFRKPTAETLKKVVLDLSRREGVELESAAAELVAVLGDGSFRDTLSTLQKVLSFSGAAGGDGSSVSGNGNASGAGKGGKGGTSAAVSLADVERITGAPKAELVLGFVRGMLMKNAEEALKALNDAGRENLDMKVFARLAMTRLRYLLMRTISEREAEVLAGDLAASDVEALGVIAKSISGQQVAQALRRMLDVYQSIGKTHVASLPLELVIAEGIGSAAANMGTSETKA